MKRRRINGAGGVSATLTNTVLPLTAGVVAGKYLPQILPASFSAYGNYVAVALGLFMAGQKGTLSNIGVGLAVGGTAGVVADLMDGSGKVGLLPPGVPSVRISGPAEMAYNTPEPVESIKVQ